MLKRFLENNQAERNSLLDTDGRLTDEEKQTESKLLSKNPQLGARSLIIPNNFTPPSFMWLKTHLVHLYSDKGLITLFGIIDVERLCKSSQNMGQQMGASGLNSKVSFRSIESLQSV